MQWNKPNNMWQQSKRGTSRAREYYFVTKHGTGGEGWAIGYRGFNELVLMYSEGSFMTAREAREACERIDANALIIEEVLSNA